MKKCSSNLLFLAIGAAVGAAVGYVVGTDKEKKDQWIDEVNNLVDRIRHNVKSSVLKGDNVLDELIDDEE